MASGRLATADREDLAAVLENLTQEMLPVTMKINPLTRSKRVVGNLDWLEEQPGDSCRNDGSPGPPGANRTGGPIQALQARECGRRPPTPSTL